MIYLKIRNKIGNKLFLKQNSEYRNTYNYTSTALTTYHTYFFFQFTLWMVDDNLNDFILCPLLVNFIVKLS